MARQRPGALSADPDQARQQIVAAAQRIFETYGVAKTTIDDIAKSLGVSRPMIYKFFRDRDELISEVIVQRSRRLFVRATKYILERDNFADQVVDGLVYLVGHGIDDPFIKLVVNPKSMDLASSVLVSSTWAAA